MRRPRASWVALLALAAAAACGSSRELVVESAQGVVVTNDQIDQDPVALFPGGVVGIAVLDPPRLLASAFGQQLLSLATQRVPIPPSSGFDPRRDVAKAWIGAYSMQGADVLGVLVGSFNPPAIEQAARSSPSALGAPIVEQPYAGRSLFVSRNVGFAALTPRTLLVGNETALRRALDRIREGRIRHSAPAWFDEMASSQSAPIVGGLDLRTNPIVGGNADQFPFMRGVDTARIVGNLEPPGLNLAGTLTYQDEQKAHEGATKLNQFRDFVRSMGFFTALLGLGNPIQKLEAVPEGKEAKFVASIDGVTVARLLDQFASSVATSR